MRSTISLFGVAMLTILPHVKAVADAADASSTDDVITITSDDVAVSGLAISSGCTGAGQYIFVLARNYAVSAYVITEKILAHKRAKVELIKTK